MKTTVIVTTYNSPVWLKKVLWGLDCQSVKDFEVVIADDGSTHETRQVIEEFWAQSALQIQHIWHDDMGFRKCLILNKAILSANGEYLIFLDGDCIPHRDFVLTHISKSRTNHFLAGSVIRLPAYTSEVISQSTIESGECFNWDWLIRNGMTKSKRNMKAIVTGKVADFLDRITPMKKSFTGGNSSAWKRDILSVGGFDNRMTWGSEDKELGVRLLNSGVGARHVRYSAKILHLFHTRSYVDPEETKKNRAFRKRNEKDNVKWTDHGIKKLSK